MPWKIPSSEPYRTLFLTVAVSFAGCFLCLSLAVYGFGWCIEDAYQKIRPSLFTGFLTIGGFLLSLKTLILVQLRKELYDSEEYKAEIKEHQKEHPEYRRYAPLKNLGEFMLWSVFAAIMTAAVHLFLAFFSHKLTVIFSLSLSLTTLALVFRAWMAIRTSLHVWFRTLKE